MSLTGDDASIDPIEAEILSVRAMWEKLDTFLQEIPFFKQLGLEKIKRISERGEMKECLVGEILVRQNEIANLFYIILQGQANCYTESDGSLVPMAVLRCGDFFGGKSLFNNLPSVATVEAEDGLICFTMTDRAFQEELTPVIKQLQEAANQYQMFIEQQI
ncbi:unnamed protein product [Rotaria sp. Silwood1]|nr:unnamed protein product [Rotaria sp. Silwood1]CAF3502942.1 unnamed protein product [Rotaria sp. Silwood1]CAF3526360.1 unnamed protein product [Rotaria sp. Silwood1]CAF4596443.1 unnamed protein product [Rotaria sp. Silwood1]CAF4656301.1 unnamed protein product [Rotaria sp. Silwood1]